MLRRNVLDELEILQRGHFGNLDLFLLRAFGEKWDANVGVLCVRKDRQAAEIHDA